MVLSNFSFDLISNNFSKKPVASGLIIERSADITENRFLLDVKSGNVYEGEFIRSKQFTGTIKKILSFEQKGKAWVEIETGTPTLKIPSGFEVFSTLNLFNISLLAELIFTFLIFHFTLKHTGKSFGKLPLVALGIVVIIWIYRNILLNNLYTYSGFYTGGTTILIILFALTFFYYQLNRPDNLFIYASPAFWIVSAILIYKTGTFFLFLYGNTLDQAEKVNFFTINSIFYIVENILFAIAFCVKGKNYLTDTQRTIVRNEIAGG